MFCQDQLNKFHPRDDYRECLHLTLILLGHCPENYKFKVPGPYHKARFMAVIIYILKIYLFRIQLGFSEADIAKMKTLVEFIIFHYLEYWFVCQSAKNVQYLDLKFYKSMLTCQDKRISNAVLKKIVLHTWYLHERYAPFDI